MSVLDDWYTNWKKNYDQQFDETGHVRTATSTAPVMPSPSGSTTGAGSGGGNVGGAGPTPTWSAPTPPVTAPPVTPPVMTAPPVTPPPVPKPAVIPTSSQPDNQTTANNAGEGLTQTDANATRNQPTVEQLQQFAATSGQTNAQAHWASYQQALAENDSFQSNRFLGMLQNDYRYYMSHGGAGATSDKNYTAAQDVGGVLADWVNSAAPGDYTAAVRDSWDAYQRAYDGQDFSLAAIMLNRVRQRYQYFIEQQQQRQNAGGGGTVGATTAIPEATVTSPPPSPVTVKPPANFPVQSAPPVQPSAQMTSDQLKAQMDAALRRGDMAAFSRYQQAWEQAPRGFTAPAAV